MIKKVIDIYRVDEGELPDDFRHVIGFSMEEQEWVGCFRINHIWLSSVNGNKIADIDFWTELCETFEDDVC